MRNSEGTHDDDRPARPRLHTRLWRATLAVSGAGMVVLLAVSLVEAVPSRSDVQLMNEGKRLMHAGDMPRAEAAFARLLLRQPRSSYARLGLACTFLHTGHLARAAMELTLATENGLIVKYQGGCGARKGLDDLFISVRAGRQNTLVVPADGDPATIARLRAPTLATAADEGRRFLLAACLMFHAKLDAAGRWYVAGSPSNKIPADGPSLLWRCLGSTTRIRLGCGARDTAVTCAAMGRVPLAAFLEDRRFLFPRERPPELVKLVEKTAER
jgi:hypothetical protein